MTKKFLVTIAALTLSLSACSGMTEREQRTVTGGAIGVAGGAAIGLIGGFNPWAGALIGGATGTAIGALTDIGKR
ncbi:MAG: hypothetical protein HY057_08050 [Rhodospirillales bacterium]|nr:hypothetical protein [Rhodospirillales bacterium]